MDLREVAAAYQSLYNVNEETEIIFEDLSQEEVDNFVEEIVDEFLEEGFELDDIIASFDDFIDDECSLLTEARAAKRQPGASKGPKPKRESMLSSQRKKLAAQQAAKKAKVESDKKSAMVVRPSSALATRPKGGALAKSSSKGGALAKVSSKGGALAKKSPAGALAKTADSKPKALSGSETKGALPATRSATSGEKRRKAAEDKKAAAAKGSKSEGPARVASGARETAKSEVKSGVRKAMTYRSKGTGKKEFIGKKQKVVQVNPNAKKAQDARAAAKAADKEQDRLNRSKTEKAKSAVKSAGRSAKDAVKSGVKKARNFVGSALSKLADKVKSESLELDSFDTVVAYLIDEGIASDFNEATEKMTKLSEATVAKIHESQLKELEELYKGKHGQSEKEYMDSRSDAGKQISGDSKMSGAAYSHRSFKGQGKPAKPGERQKAQGKMTPADRNELAIRKSALKKKSAAMEGVQTAYEAVYGGEKKEEEPKKMTVTNADKKANTKAYQNYMKGDKRYKAADHMKGDK